MFVPKANIPTTNSTDIHLPTVSKTTRRHFRSSPVPSVTSSTSVTTTPSDNVSALKAKYFDYAMWLRAASRKNREPIFTHELLKHSLCQMGIDSVQAEQLVSTCSWYVYQFHKELQEDTSSTNSLLAKETTAKKSQSTTKKRTRKTRVNKLKKTNTQRDVSDESSLDRSLNNQKDDLSYPSPPPPTRHKYSVLPSINSRDNTISPRTRHVDFDDEKPTIQTFNPEKSSHWRSGMKKIRVLPKLRRSDNDSSIITTTDINNENLALDSDISNSQRSFQKFQPTQTRSILRKQISSTSSVASLDVGYRANRSRLLTPASTIVDDIPLGTKSQKLFGGSEFFAQIMNELEEQVRRS